MKEKIEKIAYLSLLAIILFSMAVSTITLINAEKKLILNSAKNRYDTRTTEYKVLLEDKKNFLDSFAKFLASSPA
ncbi:hypothetical protein, partial [Caminibacter sp.]